MSVIDLDTRRRENIGGSDASRQGATPQRPSRLEHYLRSNVRASSGESDSDHSVMH